MSIVAALARLRSRIASEWLATLNSMAMERRTKIVATLGPASDSRERLRALLEAGVDAVRFNLSHGTHADHSERAWLVRESIFLSPKRCLQPESNEHLAPGVLNEPLT